MGPKCYKIEIETENSIRKCHIHFFNEIKLHAKVTIKNLEK